METLMNTARSSNYVCTVMTNDRGLPKIIEAVKKQAKLMNLQQRMGEVMSPEYRTYSWTGKVEVRKRWTVRVRGRLGKNNPNAELYRYGGKLHTWTSQDVKPEHSERVDIYMMQRITYVPVKEEEIPVEVVTFDE